MDQRKTSESVEIAYRYTCYLSLFIAVFWVQDSSLTKRTRNNKLPIETNSLRFCVIS